MDVNSQNDQEITPLSLENTFTYEQQPQAITDDAAGSDHCTPAMLEEGWEKETWDFIKLALESLARVVAPNIPYTELTKDPDIKKTENEKLKADVIARMNYTEFMPYVPDHFPDDESCINLN